MSTSRDRQPKGTPTGGQYAETQKPSSGIELGPDLPPEERPCRDCGEPLGYRASPDVEGHCVDCVNADSDEYEARCPACGEFIDYCQGHGEIGDPEGAKILEAHDNDDHSNCSPDSDCHNPADTALLDVFGEGTTGGSLS